MKIAVPYENGEICSHLAQVKEFLIFDVVDDEIISTKTVKQTYANDRGYGDNNIMVKFTQWGQRQLNT